MTRLLYAATALALLAVFALDPNFAANLSRVFAGNEITLPQLDRWVAGAGSVFLVLGILSLVREWRR